MHGGGNASPVDFPAMPTPAPVCKAALAEATRRWPNRSRASDGICADANHSSSSDHNDPDRDGYCEAFDLTHDPASGCDAHALVRAAVERRDPKIKYAISNGRIWSAARASEGWRSYSGSNPHTKHAHVSTADAHRDSTALWWVEGPAPTPGPVPPPLILGTPMEVDVLIRPVQIEMPLDNQGRGNVKVPYPIERIIGFLPHSEVRPNVDGRYDAVPNSVTFTPDGDGTVVVCQGDDALGRSVVWLRVAE